MEAVIGCYTTAGNPGLVWVREEQGKLVRVAEYCGIANPTYVCSTPDGQIVFAAAEQSDAPAAERCVALRMESGRFMEVGSCGLAGHRPCHLSLSQDGSKLFAANFAEGSFSVFQREADGLSPLQCIRHTGHGKDPDRQDAPHAHQATQMPGTDIVHVVDLGIDAIVSYRPNTDDGLYREIARTNLCPGLGPRHLAYGKNGMVYLCYELGNSVSTLRWSGNGFDILQTLSTLPEGFSGKSYAAAIRVRAGNVYVSNRGHDSIARYTITEHGLLALDGVYQTKVAYPRDFVALDDDMLWMAGQLSNELCILKWNGIEYENLSSIPITSPTCICLLKRD